jgi:hypothetical protein
METDPVSEMLCSLVFRLQGDGQVQKPRNSECYTPSSEPFRIYILRSSWNISLGSTLKVLIFNDDHNFVKGFLQFNI